MVGRKGDIVDFDRAIAQNLRCPLFCLKLESSIGDTLLMALSEIGLVATGRSSSWNVELDQTTSECPRWFVQIEGPCLYLFFEIQGPETVNSMCRFLEESTNRIP